MDSQELFDFLTHSSDSSSDDNEFEQAYCKWLYLSTKRKSRLKHESSRPRKRRATTPSVSGSSSDPEDEAKEMSTFLAELRDKRKKERAAHKAEIAKTYSVAKKYAHLNKLIMNKFLSPDEELIRDKLYAELFPQKFSMIEGKLHIKSNVCYRHFICSSLSEDELPMK